PKRVLDISNTSQNSVLLHKSSGETAPYVTVSYCWGVGATLKTTQKSLKQHAKEISLAAFPETLRDAILFARGLGFRYVWIDALCIIQGDDSDWTEQLNHGHLPRVRIGTVTHPQPDSEDGVGQSGITADIYAVSAPIPRYVFTHEVSRLATRGWVFQETLVSVASVYLTHAGPVWDCCTQRCRPGREPYSARGFGHPRIDRLRTLYSWVQEVSHRHLSQSRDMLPCLAGLVSRLAGATSASYLAGLWREDLLVGLTWRASKPGTLIRHADRAPSWSWASVDGPIGY
ncbi:HET-domain-containing protein, partial [Polyplosphaeria fusca]